jgi:hypothetical protein
VNPSSLKTEHFNLKTPVSPLATILASGTAVYGPILLAVAVIKLRDLRRTRKQRDRRPYGPLGNRIPDMKL